MSSEIYIQKRAPGETIEDFCTALKTLLNLPTMERRESSNYAGEQYFRCDVCGLRLQLEEADDADCRDYDYCVHVSVRRGPSLFQEALDALSEILAAELALAGYTVISVSAANDRNDGKRTIRRFAVESGGQRVAIIGPNGESRAT